MPTSLPGMGLCAQLPGIQSGLGVTGVMYTGVMYTVKTIVSSSVQLLYCIQMCPCDHSLPLALTHCLSPLPQWSLTELIFGRGGEVQEIRYL